MVETSSKTLFEEEEIIHQDEKKGPGWFLKITYIIILLFCLYYLFTFWDYKTDTDKINSGKELSSDK